MTPTEFREARERLGLSLTDLGHILDTHHRTVRKWETPEGSSARPPNPVACQVVRWMLAGFRPPEWPARDGGV